MRLTRAAACRALAAALAVLSLAAPASAQPATVLDLAAQQKNLGTFVQAVHTAGLDDLLKGSGPITIYAPTDEAFARMPAADRTALLASPDRLRNVLLGHLVKDKITMRYGDSVVSSGKVTTASGRDLEFSLDDRDRAMVGSAHLLQADLRADNGSINIIDRVLG